jgi:hypothetical protein
MRNRPPSFPIHIRFIFDNYSVASAGVLRTHAGMALSTWGQPSDCTALCEWQGT